MQKTFDGIVFYGWDPERAALKKRVSNGEVAQSWVPTWGIEGRWRCIHR